MSRFVLLPAIASLALCAAAEAQAHVHSEGGHRTPAASHASGPRYVPDAPLVKGMLRIKAAAAELAGPSKGKRERVLAQADEIAQAIDTIFAECRLEPEPDSALHPILAKLLGAVGALRENTGDDDAIAEIRQAVADYEGLFGPLP